MKKKIAFIIVLMVLLAGSVFAQNTYQLENILKDVLWKFGSSYSEIIEKNGKPVIESNSVGSFNFKTKYLFYPGFQAEVEEIMGKYYLHYLYIYDPKIQLIKGVSVGTDIDSVIKILGNGYTKDDQKSEYTYMNFMYGYGIVLYVEKGNKITRITFMDNSRDV